MRKKLFRLFIVFSALFTANACSALAAPVETAAESVALVEASAPSDAPKTEAETAASAPASAKWADHRPAESDTQTPNRATLKPSEELRRIWDNIRHDDDITVLPEVTPPATETIEKVEKPTKPEKAEKEKTKKDKAEKASGNTDKSTKTKVNVQLRKPTTPNTTRSKSKAKSSPQPAPSVKMPPAKTAPSAPVLTRRQVLEREINRERAALKAAQSQLNAARKKGNASQINRLSSIIKDRELNIKAISKEMIK